MYLQLPAHPFFFNGSLKLLLLPHKFLMLYFVLIIPAVKQPLHYPCYLPFSPKKQRNRPLHHMGIFVCMQGTLPLSYPASFLSASVLFPDLKFNNIGFPLPHQIWGYF